MLMTKLTKQISLAYTLAEERYAALGGDTDNVLMRGTLHSTIVNDTLRGRSPLAGVGMILVQTVLPARNPKRKSPRSRAAGQGGNSRATGEFDLEAPPGDLPSNLDSRAQPPSG